MPMVFHIGYQTGSPFTPMVPQAAVMPIANGALNGVGPRTVGRQKEQPHPRVGGQALLSSLGRMDLIVIHDDIDLGLPLGWIAGLQERQQVAEHRVGCARSQAVATGTLLYCLGPRTTNALRLTTG